MSKLAVELEGALEPLKGALGSLKKWGDAEIGVLRDGWEGAGDPPWDDIDASRLALGRVYAALHDRYHREAGEEHEKLLKEDPDGDPDPGRRAQKFADRMRRKRQSAHAAQSQIASAMQKIAAIGGRGGDWSTPDMEGKDLAPPTGKADVPDKPDKADEYDWPSERMRPYPYPYPRFPRDDCRPPGGYWPTTQTDSGLVEV